MRKIHDNQQGLIIMLAIFLGVAILGYIVISSFLSSEQGQDIQDKATQVIDTIDSTSEKVKSVTE